MGERPRQSRSRHRLAAIFRRGARQRAFSRGAGALASAALRRHVGIGRARRHPCLAHRPRSREPRDGARRRELAAALAYWASTFHRLPDETRASATPVGRTSHRSARDGLSRAARPRVDRRPTGSSCKMCRRSRALADLVDLRAEPAVALSAVTRAFARVYCSNAAQGDGRIARIHAVTGASALRPLLPHLAGQYCTGRCFATPGSSTPPFT